MLEILNVEVFNLERSVLASGLPMNSDINGNSEENISDGFVRAKKLSKVKQGTGHDNFLSGIQVVFDVKYPQYWSMEFQRYHFAQIISSQSKMHRLCVRQDDATFKKRFNRFVDEGIIITIKRLVDDYNDYKENFKDNEDYEEVSYEKFMRVLSNLPMGYEMVMTITTNYLQLKTIYNQRKNHRLREDWKPFCRFIEDLPYSREFITGNFE